MRDRNQTKENKKIIMNKITFLLRATKSNKESCIEEKIINKIKQLDQIQKKIDECVKELRNANEMYEKDKLFQQSLTSIPLQIDMLYIQHYSKMYYTNLLKSLIAQESKITKQLEKLNNKK